MSHISAENARSGEISIQQKTAYAVGMFVNNLQAAALPAIMVVLNLGLGMDPILVGLIGFIPRIFDAVSDPMVGYLSDHMRTRWGRRRPFIFAGAVLSAFVFAGMWQMPPGASEVFYYRFFLTASIIYFLTYTLYATPFVALGYEMTSDYHERTRLHAFANTFGQFAWLIAPWFWWIMTEFFDDTVQGASALSIVIGFAVLLGVVPAIFCRERELPLKKVDHEVASGASGFFGFLASFFGSIGETMRCWPFLKICLATFLVFNGFQLGASFSLYVMIFYVFGGVEDASVAAGALNGSFGTLTVICTFCVIPLTAFISERLGKQKTFLLTTVLSILGYALKWFCYNPAYPYLLLLACPLIAFGQGALFTLMGSMISDVCDYDELRTGQRREGVFGAIYWWMVKVGLAIAGLLTGVMLTASGFVTPDAGEAAVQSANTLLYLRLFDVGVPMLTAIIALAIMATYELSETRAAEIREELEQRREQAKSASSDAPPPDVVL